MVSTDTGSPAALAMTALASCDMGSPFGRGGRYPGVAGLAAWTGLSTRVAIMKKLLVLIVVVALAAFAVKKLQDA